MNGTDVEQEMVPAPPSFDATINAGSAARSSVFQEALAHMRYARLAPCSVRAAQRVKESRLDHALWTTPYLRSLGHQFRVRPSAAFPLDERELVKLAFARDRLRGALAGGRTDQKCHHDKRR